MARPAQRIRFSTPWEILNRWADLITLPSKMRVNVLYQILGAWVNNVGCKRTCATMSRQCNCPSRPANEKMMNSRGISIRLHSLHNIIRFGDFLASAVHAVSAQGRNSFFERTAPHDFEHSEQLPIIQVLLRDYQIILFRSDRNKIQS